MPSKKENLRKQKLFIEGAATKERVARMIAGMRIARTLLLLWYSRTKKAMATLKSATSSQKDTLQCSVCMDTERRVLFYTHCGHNDTMPICSKCLLTYVGFHKKRMFDGKAYTGCGCTWHFYHQHIGLRWVVTQKCTRNRLAERLSDTLDRRPYVCHWCPFSSTDPSVVFSHIQMCSHAPSRCEKFECGFTGTKREVDHHFAENHMLITCPICDETQSGYMKFEQHLSYHKSKLEALQHKFRNAFLYSLFTKMLASTLSCVSLKTILWNFMSRI